MGASRFLTGLVTRFFARRQAGRGVRRLAAIDAGRHPDQFREPGAEGPERREPDGEADVGDVQVAAPQERHRSFDAAGHEVAVRGLAVGLLELAAEVAGRHVHTPSEGVDVEWLGEVAVDAIANASQQQQVA